MERPFKKEMHSPQSDSIKFVVRQKHGKTGKKNSPSATKLQRATWSRVMTLKLFLPSFFLSSV